MIYFNYKAIWLYNNSKFENSYEIDTENLSLFNKKNLGVTFTCLNPKGSIQGYTRKAVFFGFYPNKFGKFEVGSLIFYSSFHLYLSFINFLYFRQQLK